PMPAPVLSAPDDHFAASPDCCVNGSAGGRVSGAGGHPVVSVGILSPSALEIMIATVPIIPSPHDHLSARPYCGVIRPANWRICCAGSCPTVRIWVISPAGAEKICTSSSPDDHFTASPYCCVSLSGFGGIVGADGYPAVRPRIISPAGIQVAGGAIDTAPDNHFTPRPNCRVIIP